jgi:tripartite-type tricarboxylate transporter receptor subunit TctC
MPVGRVRTATVAGLVLAASIGSGSALAQGPAASYPDHNITMIVGQGAGSPPDVMARMVGTPLGEVLGKPVVIENRAGASASIGAGAAAKAAPDGHTLFFLEISACVAPSLIARVSYDPVTDFAPVAVVARSWLSMIVHKDVPAKTVPEFIALAKAKPGEIRFGSGGVGTPPHLVALAFMQAAGVRMDHVPYRSIPGAVNDTAGGHIQAVFVSYSGSAGQIASGQLRVLAVTGPERYKALPQVPTFRELGLDLKQAEDGAWFSIVVPAKTPKAIVDKLNVAVNQVLQQPATRSRIEKANFKVEGGTSRALGELIKAHTSYWGSLLREAGIKPKG